MDHSISFPTFSTRFSKGKLVPPTQLDLPGSWKPLEATEFEGLAKGVEALQFLQRAQQIGKVRAFRRGGR